MSVIDDAEQALARGDRATAVHLVVNAAQRGDPNAALRLALWQLAGNPIARDLPAARQSLRMAAAAGQPDAALIEVALLANGTGGTSSWQEALQRLRAVGRHVPAAADQLSLIDAMQLTETGVPTKAPSIECLSERAQLKRLPSFFSPAECAHVAAVSADLLEPATVVDPQTGRHVAHPVRTSDGAVIGPTREDVVVRALNARIAAATGTDIRQGEALAVLRYRPGQQFRPHADAFNRTANQRILTVLVYLNEGFGGGETIFPELGVSITPRGGDAIVFANVHQDGSIDQRSRHAGLPVTHGVKWLATRWIRARPFDVWTGPESAP